MDIELLNLSLRTYNCLKRAGIETVEQLEMSTDAELVSIKGFGAKCLDECHYRLTPAVALPCLCEQEPFNVEYALAYAICDEICDVQLPISVLCKVAGFLIKEDLVNVGWFLKHKIPAEFPTQTSGTLIKRSEVADLLERVRSYVLCM